MTLRSKKKPSKSTLRPSLITTLKFTDKWDMPLDEQHVWDELQRLFRAHPSLEVIQCEIRPDLDGKTCIDETE